MKMSFFPFWGVNQIAYWEEDVTRMVGSVLSKDNVAPGLIEISTCHVGAVEGLEGRNQRDTYISFPPFVSA